MVKYGVLTKLLLRLTYSASLLGELQYFAKKNLVNININSNSEKFYTNFWN